MPGTLWASWEIVRLKSSLAQGLAASEMLIGTRTAKAIQAKVKQLKLAGDGVSRRPWPASDEARLHELIGEGLRPAEIFRGGYLPGYSRTALCNKASRLGLVDPERARRVRCATRLTEEQVLDLHLFLNQHYLRCTPEQIALMWNNSHSLKVSRRQVIYHLEKIGLKLPKYLVMRMEFSRAKRKHRSLNQLRSQNLRWKRYRQALKTNLQKLAEAVLRRPKGRHRGLEQRMCAGCRVRWPAAEPFFPVVGRKLTRAGRREYIGHLCRLCRNEQRRRKHRVRKNPSAS